MTHATAYWSAGLYGALAAAAVAIGGGLVGKRGQRFREGHGLLTAMGAGFLVALGALSALPEAYARGPSGPAALAVAGAAFGLVLLAHRAGHQRAHAHGQGGHGAGLSLYDARLAIAGLAVHALLDGVAVSAALASERELGMFVAFFIVLHKVPEGAAAAALVYASGGDTRSAQRGVFYLAVATAIGALSIFAVGPLLALSLGIAAGVTAGVGTGIATHLVKHDPRRALLGLGAGILLFALSDCLVHA